MPLLLLTYTSWLPLFLVAASRDPRFVAANGQLLAVRRDAYDRLGGFAAVAHEIVDDVAFCRRAKEHGERLVFADGFRMARCRMYDSAKGVWDGFSKNIYEGIGGTPWALALVLALHLAVFVGPYVALVLALLGITELWWPAMVGVGANVALRGVLVLRFRATAGGFGVPSVERPRPLRDCVQLLPMEHAWSADLGRAQLRRPQRAAHGGVMTAEGKLARRLAPDVRRKAWFFSLARRYVRRKFARSFDGIHVAGLEQARALVAREPLILAATHVAWWDALFAIAMADLLGGESYCLMDADNLRRLPFFGWVGAVPLDRSSPKRALRDMKAAATLLDRPGRVLWIFPQGRQRPSHLRPLDLQPGRSLAHQGERGEGAADVADLRLSRGARAGGAGELRRAHLLRER